jgi:lipid-A-disaccharide synthase
MACVMEARPLRVFISAGEPSGDAHGAALAKRLRQRCPDIELQGLGGPLMAEAGVALRMDFVQHAAMGVVKVVKRLPFFLRVEAETAEHLRTWRPDVLVPIDYPGFNLRLSRRARRDGIRVCYYVSPQVWAWKPGRIPKVARSVDHMMCLFPFELRIWEGAGLPCTFVGHPLFDELRTRRPSPAFRAGLGLLPGSRRQEIEKNLPLELKAARVVAAKDPRVRFALPVALPTLRPLVEGLVREHAPDLPLSILDGKASDVARVAKAALCASGTATLELLHYECPMVVVYQATWTQELLVRPLLVTPWIGLVNVLAQRELCPEFAGAADRSQEIGEVALELLRDGKLRKKVLAGMRALRREVDVKGIHGRAADVVLDVARQATPSAAPRA